MQIYLVDILSGDIINELGSGTVLSLADLENAGIRAVPTQETAVGSVVIDVNGMEFVLSDEPYEISAGDDASDMAQLMAGDLTVSATAYATNDGSGSPVDQRIVELSTIQGIATDGTIISTDFNQTGEAEAEGEAESEVEAEAISGAAGAAVATGATAAAAGSNALTQTLSSGSISVSGLSGTGAEIEDELPTGNSQTVAPGQGTPTGGGSTPAVSANVSVEEAEAEAEVEIEAEAEAEVSLTSASAAAGVSGAAAAVGSTLVDGTAQIADVHTALDGASATSTSISTDPNHSQSLTTMGTDPVETTPSLSCVKIPLSTASSEKPRSKLNPRLKQKPKLPMAPPLQPRRAQRVSRLLATMLSRMPQPRRGSAQVRAHYITTLRRSPTICR
ncbi:hypothetical protein [Sulfitobacter aestuariivivens]|uniref:hypothetical protein n=1 Tax=Sulfitobacter aestuariivivens TaxID=2766981 RepID=UPI00361F1206